MKKILYGTALVMIVTMVWMAGCAGLSEKEQRTLTGSMMGAAAGAGIAAIAGGNAGVGAAVGGAAGALTGYIIGAKSEKEQKQQEAK